MLNRTPRLTERRLELEPTSAQSSGESPG
jgi:hypothetical protein